MHVSEALIPRIPLSSWECSVIILAPPRARLSGELVDLESSLWAAEGFPASPPGSYLAPKL